MIGRLWIGASILMLLGLAMLGLLNEVERADADGFGILGSATRYFQSWVVFRTGIIFMVVLPLFIGIATAVVPLQIGSASIAFPRLAAASFWGWLFSSLAHIISIMADGGLGGVGDVPQFRTDATQLTLTSLGAMLVALLGASICIATTVVALRPAGMTLLRVPAFAWSMLVAASVWLLSLPVLIANLIYSWVDLQGNPPIAFGEPAELWARIEWAWSQPQIYAYAIPVLGILADIVPVKAQHRQANRPVLLSLIGLFGMLSFGAWAQSLLSKGAHPAFQAETIEESDRGNFIYEEFLYIAFAFVIVVPLLGAIGGVLDTVRRGSAPKPDGALLGAVVGAILLLAATVAGEVRAIPFWDALHIDHEMLSSITAQVGLVVAASLAAALGGLVYWAPKLFGGYAATPAAMGGVMALLGAGMLTGLSNLVAAFDGQRDIVVTDTAGDLTGTMMVISVIGSALLVLGAVSILGAIVPAMVSREVMPDDPWEGHSLEWAAPSPPPLGNFVEPIEVVRSPEPLLDEFEEVS